MTTAVPALIAATLLFLPTASLAADQANDKAPAKKTVKPKAYPMKTCVVSDEALDAMGEPHVFTYKDREIKMCCKGCKEDFDKEPVKFIKKIEAAEKKAAQDKANQKQAVEKK
jgi:hypothetical protein